MKKLIAALGLALTLGFASLGFVDSAKAHGPFGGGHGIGFRGGYGLGSIYGGYDPTSTYLYRSGQMFPPPYFAIHPPVYYSYPVPRPYGFSPYAYPETVMTPEATLRTPTEIMVNPHCEPIPVPVPDKDVPPAPKVGPASARTASNASSRPLVIINPFVQQSDLAGK